MNPRLHLLTPEERTRADAIDLWLRGYKSASGRRSMESSLRAVMRAALDISPDAPVHLEAFPWELLADFRFFSEIEELVIARYGHQRSPKYVIAMRAMLRSIAQTGFADYAATSLTLSMNKIHKVLNDPPPFSFTTADLKRILWQCRQDTNPATGRRDLALISLGASTGARRSEVVRASFSDLDLHSRTVRLLVKGGGVRVASLHIATVEHLEYWLAIRGMGAGPLFPGLRKGGHVGDTPMSDHQYWKILRQRSAEADVDPVISPHDLRRWYVSSLLEHEVDIFQVMRAVGHKKIDTTYRYDRRAQDQLRLVVDGLDLPGLSDLEVQNSAADESCEAKPDEISSQHEAPDV